jgi:hypothetical protein
MLGLVANPVTPLPLANVKAAVITNVLNGVLNSLL